MLSKILKPLHVDNQDLIRIGPKLDGGYVIHSDTIEKIQKIITCGLNDDWEFEKDFIRHNKKVLIHAYDHTVDNNFWIKRFKKDFKHFFLLKKLRLRKIIKIFSYFDYKNFFKKPNIHFIKKITKKSKNLNEICINEILYNENDVLLKVDIEGDEYEILEDIRINEKKIVSLIIEFHDVNKYINEIKNFILENQILRLIHIHANNFAGIDSRGNPNVLELTFVNKEKIKILDKKTKKKYPIDGLDFKNYHRKPDIELNFNE